MPVKDIILFDLVKEGTLLTSCISIYYWVGGIDLFFQLLLSIRILVKDRIWKLGKRTTMSWILMHALLAGFVRPMPSVAELALDRREKDRRDSVSNAAMLME